MLFGLFKRLGRGKKKRLNEFETYVCGDIKDAEKAARRLLELKEQAAKIKLEMDHCQDVVEDYFRHSDADDLIVGNAKVYKIKDTRFDFGEDPEDKKRKAFSKSLLVQFYYRVPKYNKIADALKKDDCPDKLRKSVEKFAPTIEEGFKVKIKHVDTSVK